MRDGLLSLQEENFGIYGFVVARKYVRVTFEYFWHAKRARQTDNVGE